jgi:hypothetical protein
MTYSELVSTIGAWLNDVQTEQSVPTFIRLAEAQINRALADAGITGATQRATATIDAEYAAAPSDLAFPSSARRSTGEGVEIISLASMERLKTACPDETGAPRYLTYVGGETPLRFWPVPDGAYTIELIYQARLEPLGADEATNWVLTDHPDVYLYGALVQSAPFLGEDARLSAWGGLYTAALDGMIAAERQKRGSQNTPGFRANVPHRRCFP